VPLHRGDSRRPRPGRVPGHFQRKVPAGFDPDRDLRKVGVANQTTMLATESLAIAAEVGRSLERRFGADRLDEHFRSFDTICSATQERQDAVLEMIQEPPDLMVVIGGYNSSNTNHLAHLCREYCPTYHIADATCIDVEGQTIRHKPELAADAPEVSEKGWLPDGAFTVGLTAGASTPNNKIGQTIERILTSRGLAPDLQGMPVIEHSDGTPSSSGAGP